MESWYTKWLHFGNFWKGRNVLEFDLFPLEIGRHWCIAGVSPTLAAGKKQVTLFQQDMVGKLLWKCRKCSNGAVLFFLRIVFRTINLRTTLEPYLDRDNCFFCLEKSGRVKAVKYGPNLLLCRKRKEFSKNQQKRVFLECWETVPGASNQS